MKNNISLDDLKEVLKNKGMKYTEQRAIILKILLNLDDHLSAEELHDVVREKYPKGKR